MGLIKRNVYNKDDAYDTFDICLTCADIIATLILIQIFRKLGLPILKRFLDEKWNKLVVSKMPLLGEWGLIFLDSGLVVLRKGGRRMSDV